MDSFLKICKVFDNDSDRRNEYLSEIYSNINMLVNNIESLTKNIITKESITGKKILLKPNWVNHDRTADDIFSLRTNNNFLIATIKILLKYKPALIVIGDSPIQGCKWDKVCTDKLIGEINFLCNQANVPFEIRDFRRIIYRTLENRLMTNLRPLSAYCIFDMGTDSYLEPISVEGKKLFRVAQYDYEKLAQVQKRGMHKYCLANELFESDIIISLPKVKTHQKAGLTAALKNLVGLNGDKDYLPHYRFGGTNSGGDSYPGGNNIRLLSEKVLDFSNKTIGRPIYKYLLKAAFELWKFSNHKEVLQWGASWYGNDTTWRMVLDLNKIAIYGKSDGTFSKEPQRQLFSLCDAIIAGQGDGPLFPKPLPLGLISFTNNSALNDYAFSHLMNLNPDKIPLLVNAFSLYPRDFSNIEFNGGIVTMEELGVYSIDALPPPGWVDFLKLQDH